MLAYVFWHWPQLSVAYESYRDHLIAFHETLSRHAPPGFVRSAVYRTGPSPWTAPAVDNYADWYLLESSAALDALNDGAVSPACRSAHDSIARLAGGGVAGLYRHWAGATDVGNAGVAIWFAKPPGMFYDEIRRLFSSVSGQPAVSGWGRQMTLGPAPEFCLLAPHYLTLPADFDALSTHLVPLWVGR
jgi:hypothetical protein